MLAFTASAAMAQLNVPSDGSDGALTVTENTLIDLGLARSAAWNDNNSPAAGKGVYDASKWAIVYKYTSVHIAEGATLSFANHPTHAPVVWLVSGDVTINGTINIDGAPGVTTAPEHYSPSEPGPGGFRGGAVGPLGTGAGYGPAGGPSPRGYGKYATAYGNPQIIPLIGGSGGGAAEPGYPAASGGAGGGAILIVAGGTVTINGRITAKGASGFLPGTTATYGASGAVRIVANAIQGSGTIDASGLDAPTVGRTRMEANSISPTLNIFPSTAAVAPGTTPVLWPPDNAPTVTIVSVDTKQAPADPRAEISTSSDVQIQNNGPVNITLKTQNLPAQGAVSLRVTPKYGDATTLAATFVSGDMNEATWQITTTLPQGFCTLQARATAP